MSRPKIFDIDTEIANLKEAITAFNTAAGRLAIECVIVEGDLKYSEVYKGLNNCKLSIRCSTPIIM